MVEMLALHLAFIVSTSTWQQRTILSLLHESEPCTLLQLLSKNNVNYCCNDVLERRSEFLLEVAIQVLKASEDVYFLGRTIRIIVLINDLYEETSHHVHVYSATVLDAGTERYALCVQVIYFLGERHLAKEELKYHGVWLFPEVFQLPGHRPKAQISCNLRPLMSCVIPKRDAFSKLLSFPDCRQHIRAVLHFKF
jgi:hypothetical protein